MSAATDKKPTTAMLQYALTSGDACAHLADFWQSASIEWFDIEGNTLPLAVAASAVMRGIPPNTLRRDGLMNCYLVKWRGMVLGIEPDGHAHT